MFVYLWISKHKDMTTIAKNKSFRVDFNGSSTYFLIDSTEQCWKTFSTERKALNFFKKVTEQCGE